jgi:hypothetical protein
MKKALTFAAVVLAIACQREAATRRQAEAAVSPAKASLVVPFIEDDYVRALAEAKQRNVPLFVEAWAPW